MLIVQHALRESFEPSSGWDYRRVSVIHLGPGQSPRSVPHQRGSEREGEELLLKRLLHLTANLHYTIFSDLILHHIYLGQFRGPVRNCLKRKNENKIPQCAQDRLIEPESGVSAACLFNDLAAGVFSTLTVWTSKPRQLLRIFPKRVELLFMNKCSKEFISHEQMCLLPLPTLLIASLLISQNASKRRGSRAQSCHSSLVLLVAVAEAGQTVGAYAGGGVVTG